MLRLLKPLYNFLWLNQHVLLFGHIFLNSMDTFPLPGLVTKDQWLQVLKLEVMCNICAILCEDIP